MGVRQEKVKQSVPWSLLIRCRSPATSKGSGEEFGCIFRDRIDGCGRDLTGATSFGAASSTIESGSKASAPLLRSKVAPRAMDDSRRIKVLSGVIGIAVILVRCFNAPNEHGHIFPLPKTTMDRYFYRVRMSVLGNAETHRLRVSDLQQFKGKPLGIFGAFELKGLFPGISS
jgi:hypothetical protein